jgi:hypothetical protein
MGMLTNSEISFDELSNMLAVKAIQNIGLPQFTVTAMLDAADPETLANFKLFGDELAKAYQQGVQAARGNVTDADLAEVHEHEAARLNSEPDEGQGADWFASPITIVDDQLIANLSRKF